VISTWVCMQYPRFVNDLVYFSMGTLERTLYQTTLKELRRRPLPARVGRRDGSMRRRKELKRRIDRLDEQIDACQTGIVRRYDRLCQEVFGMSAGELLKATDVFPRNDLRETFLRPLPRSRMTLYGQYNADLIPFLAREDMHQFDEHGEDHWLCVPYDANIGIFVVRTDKLDALARQRDLDADYEKAYARLKQTELDALQCALGCADRLMAPNFISDRTDVSDLDLRRRITAAIEAKLRKRIRRCEREMKAGSGKPRLDAAVPRAPRLTWDEVICLSAAAKAPFGIETRSFDTLMATFLEMVSNCGGEMRVDGRYQVSNPVEVIVPLLRALHYFRAIFSMLGTLPDQTIDPALFHEQPGGLRDYGQWLFGRYWYSGLMDALTATKVKPAEGPQDEKMRRRSFVWKGDGSDVADGGTPEARPDPEARPRIEILQMPSGGGAAGHYTCSGEWSFALLAGSENLALACDLISNLMGSLKITDRGRHGACLPTVNQFYKRHESEPCIPRTIRTDIDMPQMSFGDLGRKYLGVSMGSANADQDQPRTARTEGVAKRDRTRPTGIFRQSIFDYRHCAREIFGELLRLTESRPDEEDGDRIVRACINMLRGIDDLGGRYIFIREPFRQDVATTAVQDFDGREQWPHRSGREPRLYVSGNRKGKVEKQPCTLENVSRGGCCFKEPVHARANSVVSVSIGNVRRDGRLVNATDDRTHIAFVTPFESNDFVNLLRSLSGPR
jgi:hypothetical protein